MKNWMQFIHPAASLSCGQQGEPAPELSEDELHSPLAVAMALPLSSVSGASSHLSRATLGNPFHCYLFLIANRRNTSPL